MNSKIGHMHIQNVSGKMRNIYYKIIFRKVTMVMHDRILQFRPMLLISTDLLLPGGITKHI